MASSKRVTAKKVVATATKLGRTENNKIAAGKSTKQTEKKIGSIMGKKGVSASTMGRVVNAVGTTGNSTRTPRKAKGK